MAIKKDPNAVLDYTVDWTAWLAPVADVIVSVTWLPSPGVNVVSSSHTSNTATAFASGGVAGADEFLTCRITTAGNRTDDRTIFFNMLDR